MGSGPEFGQEFRFGVRFWARVGTPSSVLSSGSEFGSGFCGVRNVRVRVRVTGLSAGEKGFRYSG